MSKVAKVDAAGLDGALGDDGLVMVDFWSPDCAPCRTLSPILDDIAATYAGDVAVLKLDIAADPAVAERLAIRGVPTVALFRDGREVDRVLGLRTQSQLSHWLDAHL